MLLPSETKYYVPVTTDKTLIPSAMVNFPHQIDLSTKLATDGIFKSNILSENNISVYDPLTQTIRPRLIDLDLATNKLLISFDGETSAATNKVFLICAGPLLSDVDSPNSFSNSGYTNKWSINEFANGATTYDSVGVNNGNVVAPATIGNAGRFGNCTSFGTTGYLNCGNVTTLNSATTFGIEMLVNSSSYTGVKRLLRRYVSDSNLISFYWWSDQLVLFIGNSSTYGRVTAVGFENDTWYHIFIVYDGDGVDNPAKLKMYINGIQRVLTFTGTIPSITGDMAAVNLTIGHSAESWNGLIDEVGIVAPIKDSDFITTRYTQFFTPEFFNIGMGINAEVNRLNNSFILSDFTF